MRIHWGDFWKDGGKLPKELARRSSSIEELAVLCGKAVKQKVTVNAVRCSWQSNGVKPPPSHLIQRPSPEELGEQVVEEYRARRSGEVAKQANKALATRVHELEDQLKVALAVGEGAADLPRRPLKVKHRAAGKRLVATAVALASDWHMEERVDPATVNGRNFYDLKESKRRAEKFFRGILWLIEHHRRGFDIEELVLWLGGDLITGYIHDELEESNFLSPPEAILFVMDTLVAGIDLLLAEAKLKRLRLPCNRGNHGRLSQKKKVSTASANSLEWMLYKLLAKHYRREPRVEFLVSDGDHLYLEVQGYTIRFTHGDSFKYAGGTGGLMVPIRRGLGRLEKYRKADLTCLGHFHQTSDNGDVVTNGSLIGYNAYALSISAAYEPPQQTFFLMEPRHGKSLVTPIWLD